MIALNGVLLSPIARRMQEHIIVVLFNVLLHEVIVQTGVGISILALGGDDLHREAGVILLGSGQGDVLIGTVAGSSLLKGLADFDGALCTVDLDVQGGSGVGGGVLVDGLHSSYLFLSGLLALLFCLGVCSPRCDYIVTYRNA